MWNWMMLGLESNRGLRRRKYFFTHHALRFALGRFAATHQLRDPQPDHAVPRETKLLSSIEERWRQTPNGSAANEHGANENHADPSAAGAHLPCCLTAHSR
jgi:hypothetical protein